MVEVTKHPRENIAGEVSAADMFSLACPIDV